MAVRGGIPWEDQAPYALCIIPPKHLWPQIDRLRSGHDRFHPRWPPHIRLMVPFDQRHGRYLQEISHFNSCMRTLAEHTENYGPITICIGPPNTDPAHASRQGVFLCVKSRQESRLWDRKRPELRSPGDEPLKHLGLHLAKLPVQGRCGLERSLWSETLTIGQPRVNVLDNRGAAEAVARSRSLLTGLEWEVNELHVLVRSSSSAAGDTLMIDYATISLKDGGFSLLQVPAPGSMLNDPRLFYKGPTQPTEKFISFFHDGTAWSQKQPTLLQPYGLPAGDLALTVASYNTRSQTSNHDVLDQLLSAKSDVLILQEATDTLVLSLLHEERMQKQYKFCTHRPSDINPSGSHHSRIIVFSKYAFGWENLPLPLEAAEQHEGASDAAVLFELCNKEEPPTDPLKQPKPVILVACHLTSGFDDAALLARERALKAINEYVYHGSPIMLVGNFNIASSSCQERSRLFGSDVYSGFEEVWLVMKMKHGAGPHYKGNLPCPGVPMFGPAPYAPDASVEPSSCSDDILVSSNGIYIVQGVGMFGDDRGVQALLQLQRNPTSSRNASAGLHKAISATRAESTKKFEDLGSVLDAVEKSNGIPLLAEYESRATAFDLVKRVLLDSTPSGVDLKILPVGSYALDVWTSSSDLNCLCIGSFGRSNFIQFATESFSRAGATGIKFLRQRDTKAGTALDLEVRAWGNTPAVRVELKYARVDLTYARSEWSLPDSDVISLLPLETQWALKAYRELNYILRSVPDIAAFQLAHRYIRSWAEGRGIHSAKFGYLSSHQITILLMRVHKTLAKRLLVITVARILLTFFREYASFDWKGDLAFDECFHDNLSYHRTNREPLAILGYFQPTLSTSLSSSVSSAWTMKREFKKQQELIEWGGTWSKPAIHLPKVKGTWESFLTGTASFPPGFQGSELRLPVLDELIRYVRADGTGFEDDVPRSHNLFFNFRHYIKIRTQFWGGHTTKARGFVAWVESRCKSLLVDLETHAPSALFRMWPVRFAEDISMLKSESDKCEDEPLENVDMSGRDEYMSKQDVSEQNYIGFYIIGIDWMEPKGLQKDIPDAMGDVERTLGNFEQQIRGHERHYDSRSVSFSSEIAVAEFRGCVVDRQNWDEHIPGDIDPEAQVPDDGQEAGQVPDVQDIWHASTKKYKKRRGKSATNQPRSAVPKIEGAGKMRPASDVLHRLRWDPTYDLGDFVVGYEDRFVGTMEKELDGWKLEQTHEEFIPQHRILYFKRKSDRAIVWERRTRTDLVFGSG